MGKITTSKIIFWLNKAGLSLKRQASLLKLFTDPLQLWDEFKRSDNITKILDENEFNLLMRTKDLSYIEKELEKLKSDGISVMTIFNPLYPKLLRFPEANCPFMFYYKGNIDLLNTMCLAIVGTRKCSPYGRRVAENIAVTLAKADVTVVSGLAMGIDAYAARAVLDCGGKTIAVLGGGHNRFSPIYNQKLYDDMISSGNGLVLSEYPPDYSPTKFSYPARNRIISALSRGITVVEAPEKSGSLITADFALEQNRDVFVVPANVDLKSFAGSNALLYEGAIFVRNGEDILNHYGIFKEKSDFSAKIQLDKDEKTIYSLMETGCSDFDFLKEKSGLNASDLGVILTTMELKGVIKKQGNGYIIVQN